MEYTFSCKDSDGKTVTVTTQNESLVDRMNFGLLYDIKCFLLGCGFVIKGDLEIVPEDDPIEDDFYD